MINKRSREDHSFLSGREKNNIMLSDLKGGKEAVRKELEAEGVTVEDGSLIENAVRISDYDFCIV